MRKHFLAILAFILTCSVFVFAQQRNCGSMEHLELQKSIDPMLEGRMESIERFTQDYLKNSPNISNKAAVITIPVVFHVVYRTNAENLSTARIQEQLDVLNEDFRRQNADADNTWSQAADTEIQFCLATVDPNGNPTSGITRTQTSVNGFGFTDDMKFDSQGGIDAWNTSNYMNFWVCNLGGGLLGFATFPGGNPATDGVVCDYRYTGITGASAPFNLGRTGTHEVGHYLNLYHIWGDGGCGVGDNVADTPNSDGPNYGCATGNVACGTVDMVQNYMDYSDDGCMNLFTTGQKARMQAVLAPGGARSALANSTAACGNQCITDGGTISTTSSTTVCALDGVADVIDAVAGNDQVGDDYGWLITDAATGTILSPGVVAMNSATFSPDLEGAPVGTCQIWAISWNGTLSGATQGANVSGVSSDQCFDLSNSIDVERKGIDGGSISTTSTTTVCALDGNADIIDAVAGNDQVGDNYAWLITDAATGTILSPGAVAQNTATFSPDLEGAPVGTCQIWVISWNGNLTGATQGANVSGVSSDQCFDLSNSIDVVRETCTPCNADGGTISTTSPTTVCALDGVADIIDAVAGNDQVGDDYGWLITDAATGTILSPGVVAINSATFSPDLEGAPVGTCQIWAISWNGTLTGATQGANVSDVSSDECFDLSNSIDVERKGIDGGSISTTSPTTVCALDGNADIIDAVAGNDQVGDNYGWLITDAATGTILSPGIVAQNTANFSPDLEGAPVGTCQIWAISWNGNITGATQGANVSGVSSDECFDLSNPIDVVRDTCTVCLTDGGSISTTSVTTVCALDGNADIIDAVAGNDQVGDDYGWLITDAATGTILSPGVVAMNSATFSPDLEGAPVGTCQIWAISWNGNLTGATQGANVSGVSSDECFDLSNPIDVVRENCACTTDGGSIGISGCGPLPWTAPDISFTNQSFNWTSNTIDISCASSTMISMDLEGLTPQTMEANDFLNIYYELDGGTPVAISLNNDGFALKTVTANVSGSSLVLIVEGKNSTVNETYNVSNILVEGLGTGTSTSVTVCALDGVPDIIDAVTGNDQVGDDYGWLITDAATGTILSPGVVAQNTATFSPDLEGAPIGTCQIWVISWNGNLTGAIQGANVSDVSSDECFDLSNPIDVVRNGIDGGSISTTSTTTVCALDGNADVIDAVAGNDQVGDDYGWLITDAATGTILSNGVMAQNSATFSPDLEGAPVGTCQIWVISWNGNLTGATQGANVSDVASDECFDLSNPIDVVRENCPIVCTDNEVNLTIELDNYPGETTWEITDANGAVLESGGPYYGQTNQTVSEDFCLPDGCYSFTIFDSYGDGICCSYGNGSYLLSSDNVPLASGGNFNTMETTTWCVGGCQTFGGTISTTSPTSVCALDGVADIIDAVAGNDQVGDDYGWLITDAATGTILSPGVVAQNMANFSPDLEGAPVGTCQIWVISWNGNLMGATQGANVSDVTSDECFDLSNSIDVIRKGIDGGSISTMSADTVCALDGNPDVIDAVTGNDQVGDDYGWLITDAATGTILSNGVVAMNSTTFSPDLEGAPEGTCQIWVVSWNGNLTGASQGNNVTDIASDECFALSNPIDVVREDCTAPCLENEVNLTLTLDNYPGETSWEILDASGTVIESGGPCYGLQGQTINETFCLPDGCYTFTIFDSYGDGICCNYGQGSYELSTDTTILASGGDFTFEESTVWCVGACPIFGGTISTTSPTTVCALDGVEDIVDVDSGGDQIGDNYGWLITDAATGTILSPGVVEQNMVTFSPDLEGAPVGTCQIWLISWNGTLMGATQGANASDITSDECFELSNPIDVVRNGIDGGSISTTSPTTVCALDGVADIIDAVAGNDQVGDDYGWLITDAATGTILSPGVVAQNSATFSPDLEGAPVGTCQIWVISWNGTLTGAAQGANVSDVASDQCFALSNPIDVVRNGIDGGSISTTSPTTVCALDGVADIIDAVAGNDQVGNDYGWLITDAATGTILSNGVMAQNSATFSPDLEGAPVGTCQIWVISWNGTLTGAAQGANVTDIASDQCFALSNSIDVVRNGIDGGSISTTSPTTVCALDGIADVIDAVAGNDQVGDDYGWLITDAATGTILSPGVVAQNSATFSPDLEGAPYGTCQIWVISWNGTLTGAAQGANVTDVVSDQCFALSNPIDVVRENCNCVTDGGSITTTSATTVCALDGVADVIDAVAGNDQVGDDYGWLITDAATGTILSPGVVAQNSATFSPDLEGAPVGTCQIWVISWNGNLTGATQGANVSDVSSDQCFDLSNSIDLVRNGIDGGSISTTSTTTVCALDSLPDVIDAVAGNDQVGDDYGWLITDAATGTILSPGIVAQGSATFSPDLEGAPVGTCQIWVISWNGTITGAAQGANVSAIASDQCFALSNPIDVVREDCSGNCTENLVTLDIQLDNYANETTWAVVDANGDPVATGGPYYGMNNQQVTEELCLPDGCYDFIIRDSYGDGICCSYGQGSYELSSGTTVLASGGDFNYIETTDFCLGPVPAPTCTDGIQNGDETGVDCGGTTCPPCQSNCDVVDTNDFEAGWGVWNDGGYDARRSINDANYADSGDYCVRLRDNSGRFSSMFTDQLALSGYNEVTVDFSYYARSMEFGEDFWFDVLVNGNWIPIKNWARGSDFNNNQRMAGTVTVQGNFTNTTRFRIRCDASSNADLIYIDDVSIEACSTPSNKQDVLVMLNTPNPVQETGQELPQITELTSSKVVATVTDINLYPNPTSDQLTVEFEATGANGVQFMVIDLTGKMVHQETLEVNSGVQSIQFDAGRLVPGYYFVHLVDGKTRTSKKFAVAR